MTIDISKNKITKKITKILFFVPILPEMFTKTVSVRNSFWDNMIINKDTDTLIAILLPMT